MPSTLESVSLEPTDSTDPRAVDGASDDRIPSTSGATLVVRPLTAVVRPLAASAAAAALFAGFSEGSSGLSCLPACEVV